MENAKCVEIISRFRTCYTPDPHYQYFNVCTQRNKTRHGRAYQLLLDIIIFIRIVVSDSACLSQLVFHWFVHVDKSLKNISQCWFLMFYNKLHFAFPQIQDLHRYMEWNRCGWRNGWITPTSTDSGSNCRTSLLGYYSTTRPECCCLLMESKHHYFHYSTSSGKCHLCLMSHELAWKNTEKLK